MEIEAGEKQKIGANLSKAQTNIENKVRSTMESYHAFYFQFVMVSTFLILIILEEFAT